MAADFDEPVFDDDFIRGATFTEPSAAERMRPPSRRAQRSISRAAKRARRADGGVRLPRRRRDHDPSHRSSVLKLVGIIAVLFAISFGLWLWNSGPAEPEPVRPGVPAVPEQPPPAPDGPAPGGPGPAPGGPEAPPGGPEAPPGEPDGPPGQLPEI